MFGSARLFSGSAVSGAVGGRRRRGLVSATVAVVAVALVVTGVELTAPLAAQAAVPATVRAADVPAAGLSAPDGASAMLTARVRGRRVEILAERTEESSTFAEPDGSYTSESFAGPVRMRDASAKDGWVDLDPTLVRGVDGSVRARVHPEFLRLSGAVAGLSGTSALVSVIDPDDPLAAEPATRSRARSMSWGWQGALPAPVLEGTKATYADVKPGVDLVVEATTTGFEQFLVLKDRPVDAAQAASVAVTMPVLTNGLKMVKDARGGATISDADGVTQGHLPAPVMWDARTVVGRRCAG